MYYDLEFEKEFIKYQEKEQQEEVKKFKEKTSNYYILGYIYKLEQENKQLKEKQHEFIDYLEEEIKRLEENNIYQPLQRMALETHKHNLLKYKEIIGSGK